MRDFAANASDDGARFADMFYSAAYRRSHHDHRMAIVAATKRELAKTLEAHLKGESLASLATGVAPVAARPRVVFVCTGMGPQWWAMGRQLFAEEPVFRETILECDEAFRRVAHWSLLMEMMADEPQSRMTETQVAQTANFAIQVALAAFWRSWGVEPDAIVGHSVGEVSAGLLSGALEPEDAIRVSYHRSRLQQTTAGPGAMMAVDFLAEKGPLLVPYGGSDFQSRRSMARLRRRYRGDPGAINVWPRS